MRASWQIWKRIVLHHLKQNTKIVTTMFWYRDENTPGKMSYALTIPVNNIDTIPDRPRPSASMYLTNLRVYTDLHHEWKNIRKPGETAIKKWSVKIAYEKYGKRTKRQLSKFWRLDRIIKFFWSVFSTCNMNHQTTNIWKKTDILILTCQHPSLHT